MKKIFNSLFTIDSCNNIRIWYMEVDGENYRTVSGLQNGEQVVSEWSKAEAKNIGRSNATTAEEQAVKEVESRYKKQLKTGYFEKVEEVNNFQYVEPMLAKSFEDYRHSIDLSNKKWWLNIKYNGIRMIATKDGLYTRKGEKFVSVPHIEESLKPFFEKYPNAVLDGECFNLEYRQQLNEIVKLARKTKHITALDLKRSRELIKYYVYDGYNFENNLNEEAPYHQRKAWIDKNVTKYEFIESVPEWIIDSQETLNQEYASFVASGHEGGILRFSEMSYEHKRSKNLLKIKPVDDDEFIIEEIKEGSGNWSGKAKIISLRSIDSKLYFDSTFKGTMEEAKKFLEEKNQWIGKKVTIFFNGLTGLGVPQYAQFDPKNSFKGDR